MADSCLVQMSIPVNRQVLKYKGKSLVNGKTLASYGIQVHTHTFVGGALGFHCFLWCRRQDNDMLQVEAIAG